MLRISSKHLVLEAACLALTACAAPATTLGTAAQGTGGNLLSQAGDANGGAVAAGGTSAIGRHAQPSAYVASLAQDAQKLQPQFKQALALSFLDQARSLPRPLPRALYAHQQTRQLITPEAWAMLSASEQAVYALREHSDELYYSTFYGNPLAYARAFEVLGANGFRTLTDKRVLDLGYGAIAAPRMMAAAGAHVHAVDVDPSLAALYRDENDQGVVANIGSSVRGTLTLHDGVYASNAHLMKALTIDGGKGITRAELATRGFDLIVSKNTLKRGFMKPAPGRQAFVSFGVSDEALLQSIHDSLAPGGYLLIYNISGRLDVARPATDGRSPFTAAQFAQAKLTVVALDQSDDDGLRAMARALGWEAQMGHLSTNLFGLYTLVKR
jgi:SAM-dependent methyltransferase